MQDGEAAQDDVAEQGSPQMARGRHHPAHAEERSKLFSVSGGAGAGTDDFLHRDHVGLDAPDHVGDTFGTGAAVETAAAVDVIGGDPESSPMRVAHRDTTGAYPPSTNAAVPSERPAE